MNDAPSPEAVAAARNEAFDAIEAMADTAASYARSAGEAAFRGDAKTVETHLRQLRACVVAMILTYKENLSADGPAGIRSERPAGVLPARAGVAGAALSVDDRARQDQREEGG